MINIYIYTCAYIYWRYQIRILFTNGCYLPIAYIFFLIIKMSTRMEYIISSWEIESFIDNLQISDLENIGTKGLIFFFKH